MVFRRRVAFPQASRTTMETKKTQHGSTSACRVRIKFNKLLGNPPTPVGSSSLWDASSINVGARLRMVPTDAPKLPQWCQNDALGYQNGGTTFSKLQMGKPQWQTLSVSPMVEQYRMQSTHQCYLLPFLGRFLLWHVIHQVYPFLPAFSYRAMQISKRVALCRTICNDVYLDATLCENAPLHTQTWRIVHSIFEPFTFVFVQYTQLFKWRSFILAFSTILAPEVPSVGLKILN